MRVSASSPVACTPWRRRVGGTNAQQNTKPFAGADELMLRRGYAASTPRPPPPPSAPRPPSSPMLRRGHPASPLLRAVAWKSLDSSDSSAVQLVCLGNPHLSVTECEKLADLCEEGHVHPDVSMVGTLGRHVYAEAEAAGHISVLETFGMTFITDTCWCMLTEPVIPLDSSALITNSGKYAHYAPGLINRDVRFSSMAGCVAAARSGQAPPAPGWLSRSTFSSWAGHGNAVERRSPPSHLAGATTQGRGLLSAFVTARSVLRLGKLVALRR